MIKTRYLACAAAAVFVAGCVAGFINRSSYTNFADLEDPFDSMEVGLFSDGMMDIITDDNYLQDIEKDSAYILRVKGTGSYEFEYKHWMQTAIVEEVYKGSDVAAGEEITIAARGDNLYMGEEFYGANMYFSNVMQEGEEYLVFLEEKLELVEDPKTVYVTPMLITPTIYALEDGASKPVESDGRAGNTAEYATVKDYEYFALSDEALDALYDLKHRALQLYVSTKE